MSANDAVAERAPILLTIKQVPLGSTVYVCKLGTSEPLRDDDGELVPPLTKLVGGIPLTTKLYPVPTLTPGPGGSIRTVGFSSVKRGVRFRPVEIYTKENAPVRTEFASFFDGKRLKYRGCSGGPDWDGAVKLYMGSDGWLVSTGTNRRGEIVEYLREIDLSHGVQLVATTEIGKAEPPHLHADYWAKQDETARAEDERLLSGETFSPSNAPERTYFAAFLDGKRAGIKLYKGSNGVLVSATDRGELEWAYLRSVNFGDDVVLAPISQLGKANPPWGHSDCRKALVA